MGLYSSFDPSDYYDDEPVKKPAKQQIQQEQQIQKPVTPIKDEVRKSLYDQAKEVATSKSEYTGPNFLDIYRVGQAVAVQGPNGQYRTQKGVIAEIVAKNLMYVYMEDSYKDATGQWLADFVTDTDRITLL